MPGTDAGRGAAEPALSLCAPTPPSVRRVAQIRAYVLPGIFGYHFLRESCLDFRYRDSYFGDLRCSPHSLSFRQALPNTSLHKTRGL